MLYLSDQKARSLRLFFAALEDLFGAKLRFKPLLNSKTWIAEDSAGVVVTSRHAYHFARFRKHR
jgi:hypothetical protein